MEYAKPCLGFEQQADKLIKRGMQCNRESLIEHLSDVGYYRLSGYWYIYRNPDGTFREGTTFDSIWQDYVFDRQFRLVALDAIERVEIYFRIQLAHVLARETGPFGFMEPSSLPRLEDYDYQKLIKKCKDKQKQSREPFARNDAQYRETYKNTSLVLNAKYTYEEVCRLLNWSKNINGQNIGGYKYDAETNTFPVFINYDKDPDIDDSINYEDRFVSERELIAISKQPRSLESPEIERLRNWPSNGMCSYLFVRKNKDDRDGGKEFYFLGEIYPTGSFESIVMPGTTKGAVEIAYRLDRPVRADLYDYITSNIEDDAISR